MVDDQRTRIEEIDWVNVFPFTRIFRSFRIAIHPPKLLAGLVLVISLYLVGLGMDGVWGGRVLTSRGVISGQQIEDADNPLEVLARVAMTRDGRAQSGFRDELEAYQNGGSENYHRYVEAQLAVYGNGLAAALKDSDALTDEQKKQLAEAPTRVLVQEALSVRKEQLDKTDKEARKGLDAAFVGIFATVVKAQRDAFAEIPEAIMDLSLLRAFDAMVNVLKTTFYYIPGWLFTAHWEFAVVYLLIFLALFSLLGGTIARMIALQATREEQISTVEAIEFARSRFVWFLLSPLIPIVLIMLIGVLIAFGGLLLNWPVADVLAALLYFLALIAGFVIAVLLIGLVAGGGLLFPAIAVEGTEAFDAISRAFNYVLGRPWRWLLYTVVSIVYSAIVLGFVVIVVSLTTEAAAYFAGWWVWKQDGGGELTRFEAMVREQGPAWDQLEGSGDVAASIIFVWMFVMRMFIAAFFISLFLTTNTWIYLLLRRSADGTEYDDVYMQRYEDDEPPAGSGPGRADAGGSENAPQPG